MLPPRRANWWRLGWLLSLLMFAGWLLSLVGVYVWGHRDTARPVAAIVVMGAAQYAGRPSPVFRARSTTGSISGGAAWLRESFSPAALATAIRRARPRSAERYAIDHGVTPRAIMIENAGRSTAESLQHVAALMDAEPSRDRGSRERSRSTCCD